MKPALQVTLAIASLIPLFYAVTGVLYGAGQWMGDDPYPAVLDNQYRYLSAIYFAISFALWYVIADVARRGAVLRIVVAAFVLGGLARLYSTVAVGPGEPVQLIGMALELSTPLLAIWQAVVARRAS